MRKTKKINAVTAVTAFCRKNREGKIWMGDKRKGGEVVPFGKYKGQPVEVMMADPPYCERVMAQPWFRDKLGALSAASTAGGVSGGGPVLIARAMPLGKAKGIGLAVNAPARRAPARSGRGR
jgi:hypothetical protein